MKIVYILVVLVWTCVPNILGKNSAYGFKCVATARTLRPLMVQLMVGHFQQ